MAKSGKFANFPGGGLGQRQNGQKTLKISQPFFGFFPKNHENLRFLGGGPQILGSGGVKQQKTLLSSRFQQGFAIAHLDMVFVVVLRNEMDQWTHFAPYFELKWGV